MQNGGFNFDSFIEVLAERVAEKVRDALSQIDGTMIVKPRLLTVEQAATYMGRTQDAMQHMIASGKIQTVRIDRRVSIDVRDIDRLIEDNKTPGVR